MVSDDEIILRVKNGDIHAFEHLVERYEKKVYTIAYRYTGDYNDASDLAQESFIRAYKSIHTFRGESSFFTWLSRVVTNVCKDELRRRVRRNVVSMDEMIEKGNQPVLIDSNAGSLEEAVLLKEWHNEIQRNLDSMSPDHRTVLIMRDVQGYSYEEMAATLKCSLGTVKSRLNRARHILKDKLLAANALASDMLSLGR